MSEKEIVQGMEHFDDVVDQVVWMVLIDKQDVVEKLEKNMDDVFVLQYAGEYPCNHKMNHSKHVDKIGEGYIEINMATLTQEYSMVLKLQHLFHLFYMMLPSQIMKSDYLWYAPFDNDEKTLHQIQPNFS